MYNVHVQAHAYVRSRLQSVTHNVIHNIIYMCMTGICVCYVYSVYCIVMETMYHGTLAVLKSHFC